MELHEGIPKGMAGDESAAYDWLIGQTISANYRLLKRLGSGGMATVFQAEQISLGKMVAIKVMRSELMADLKLTQRFELEARAASTLNHPHLIQIIDCGRDQGFLYIAMELLTGIDLGCLLRRQTRLSLERSARIIDQVLCAVDEAHTHGVVHRDLKPDNIMLVSRRGDPDFVKVCDFGVAKACGRDRPNLTVAGLVFGTPEYMSPEQARGVQVDCRSDLYSIATILYEMIVGQIPFVSSSAADVLARQLLEAPAPPSSHPDVSIPPLLEDLIMRGLAKKATDRPQTAAAFQAELHHALAEVVDHWPSQGPRIALAAEVPAPAVGPSAVPTLHGSQPAPQPDAPVAQSPEVSPALEASSTEPGFPAAGSETAAALAPSGTGPRPSGPRRIAAMAGIALIATLVSAGAFVVRTDELRLHMKRPAPALATVPPAGVRRRPVVYAALPMADDVGADDDQDVTAAEATARAGDTDAAHPSRRSGVAPTRHATPRTRSPQRSARVRTPGSTSRLPSVPASAPEDRNGRDDLMAVSPGPAAAQTSMEGAGAATMPHKPGGSSE